MKPEVVIVRLGDLTLKGRNRYKFEQQVRWQVQAHLISFTSISIRGEFARLYITLNGEPYETVAEALKPVFGISSFSPAIKANIELGSIQSTGLQWMESLPFQPKTFRVTVKRGLKEFPYDSLQTSYLVGGYVLAGIHGLKVDVHQPEVELHVDIRPEAVYIFTEVIKGTGGFPIGSNGKAILMLSGGIDSPVAGWLAMRQGLEIEAIHFHSFPYTSERAKQKVIDLTQRLSLYGGSIKLHLVSYAAIQTRLQLEGQANLLVTLMRRSMLRITEQLALHQKALGIVSGESLGQVASQTLSSLHTIGQAAVQLQLLRPLIMTDKNAIIDLARQIETFAISILPYEDCCTLFIPKTPSTNPNLKVVVRLEQAMPWLHEAEKHALETREIQTLSWDSEKAFDHFFI